MIEFIHLNLGSDVTLKKLCHFSESELGIDFVAFEGNNLNSLWAPPLWERVDSKLECIYLISVFVGCNVVNLEHHYEIIVSIESVDSACSELLGSSAALITYNTVPSTDFTYWLQIYYHSYSIFIPRYLCRYRSFGNITHAVERIALITDCIKDNRLNKIYMWIVFVDSLGDVASS